jgi:ADP-heptose:LPS heptosyltransferase
MDGHNLVFVCQGGLGDQLCAEPVIRHARRIFPRSKFFVVTEEKDFFHHLDATTIGYGEVLETPGDLPTLLLKTFRMEEAGLNCNLVHPVDFTSLSALGRQIPLEERNVTLGAFGGPTEVCSEDVMVHPGLTWPSRTFPSEWWQDVVDNISKRRRVVLVGTKSGTVKVECPNGCLDLRGCSMRRFLAEISSGCAVVTNDSLPVHVAGAFNNWICLVPTCKHHDFVLPYRMGSNKYRTTALFKKLMSEEIRGGFDKIPEGRGMLDYLPDPSEVAEECCLRSRS